MAQRAAAVALLLLVSACSPPPSVTGDVSAEVTALVQRWSDASEAGDVQALADTYADRDGFAWIERGAVSYTSRAAIVDGLSGVEGASITNDVSDISVTPLSDGVAAFRAHYAFQVRGAAFQFESEGIMSGVAIKEGETWRFLQGAFSEIPIAG
jgi:hypothetical protein